MGNLSKHELWFADVQKLLWRIFQPSTSYPRPSTIYPRPLTSYPRPPTSYPWPKGKLHAFVPFQAKINLKFHVTLRSLIGSFNWFIKSDISVQQAKTIQNMACLPAHESRQLRRLHCPQMFYYTGEVTREKCNRHSKSFQKKINKFKNKWLPRYFMLWKWQPYSTCH